MGRQQSICKSGRNVFNFFFANTSNIVSINKHSVAQAQREIKNVINIYNNKRPHISCDYVTPVLAQMQKTPSKDDNGIRCTSNWVNAVLSGGDYYNTAAKSKLLGVGAGKTK